MEYFQVRKNSRQVIHIYRGPYEGLDITRIQLRYKNPDDGDYKPGRTIALASESILGLIEGLTKMCDRKPTVNIGVNKIDELSKDPVELNNILQRYSALTREHSIGKIRS